jgi:acyl carrier protein
MAGETYEVVRKLIAEVCAIKPEIIQPAGKLAGYGLDSLRALELVVSIEDHYRLQVDQEQLFEVKTVNDLVEHIERLKREQAR